MTRVVDETYNRLMTRDNILDQYFPIQTYMDFEILWLKVKDRPAIASVVGFDGEVPITQKGQATEIMQDTYKFVLSYLYTESDMKVMLTLMQRLRGGESAFAQEISNLIFGRLEDLVQSVRDLMDLLCWQLLYQGSVDYTDPRTKAKVRVSYSSKIAGHFPTALAGGNRWSQAATANGLDNLRTLSETYYDNLGYFPDRIVMRRKDLNKLLAQTTTKEAFVAATGSAAGATNQVVSRLALGEMLVTREIPPIHIFDDRYTEENAKGTSTEKPFLPEGYIVFLTGSGSAGNNAMTEEKPPGNPSGLMGQRAFGPVISNNNIPGIYSFTEEVSKEPAKDRSVASATGTPIVWDARHLAGWKID
ncbi:MAG: hypothetical protein HC857_00560 [Synechococcales cyanobacterium RU_4_20]|nr:hypothetical protein [Synechococcales cyanobacterium RU_4_20]